MTSTTGRLAHIFRHPIKSIGWEALAEVELSAGETLPFDRHWAVAHDAARFGGTSGGWQDKRNFVRGVAGPQLMAVRAALSSDGQKVRLNHHQRPEIEIAPDAPGESDRLVAWLAPLWPDTRPAAARIVTAGAQAMTDVPDPFVALLNLASLRALGEMLDRTLSVHRFRGNLWVDGVAPWAESGWIGKEIRIGSAGLRIEAPITRCNATKVDPETGQVDADTLGALSAAFGHRDFGVYATVINSGTVRPGDEVAAP
ncbi:MOSC domain-containing protein [Tropicimonas sp. IMCC6043]|uniref:MOSC domain-containing protein n=1 Tax=Tropicimonas sp. IMCC6043 TaxID=2510645 RepID=UPI00101B70D8|nr:MOSC domain-containing protein [Tropicimonas sp. IMCC6043]RYH08970.1 MOSC domain-containing protein [Tropicimonas sp. IMCC6043]